MVNIGIILYYMLVVYILLGFMIILLVNYVFGLIYVQSSKSLQ